LQGWEEKYLAGGMNGMRRIHLWQGWDEKYSYGGKDEMPSMYL
jgi:hypothetical protein